MSKLFCVSPGLQVLERQMQQPPGYRPRGYGICVMDVDWRSRGNYSEIVDCVISRMQMEHLKKRVDEIFCEVDKELIFRNPKHRNDFYSLLMGKRAKTLQYAPGYAAAVFLLSADEILWEKVRKNVLDIGIYFDRVRLGGVTLEQYILFHAAKDVYSGTKHIRLSELTDRELVLYRQGKGVPQDDREAHRLFQRSHKQGNAYASYELAKMYEQGIGIPANPELATDCYRVAFLGFLGMAKKGKDDTLLYRIGAMYLHGKGTEPEEAKAVQYFEKSAEYGNVHAKYQLARIYLKREKEKLEAGQPAEKEKVRQAIAWLTEFADQGNDFAAYAL